MSFDGETWHTEITEPVVIGFLPVTVGAMPDEDWEFVHWLDNDDSIVSTDTEYTFIAEENITLTAIFERLTKDTEDKEDKEDEEDNNETPTGDEKNPPDDNPTDSNNAPHDDNNPTDNNEPTDGNSDPTDNNNDPTNNGNDPESKPDEKSGSEEPNAEADISILADELEENGFAANTSSSEWNISPLRAGAYSRTEANTSKSNRSFVDLWQLLPFFVAVSIVVYIIKIKKRQR